VKGAVVGSALHCVRGRVRDPGGTAPPLGRHPPKRDARQLGRPARPCFYEKPPFHTGKTVKVNGVTYALGITTSVGGKPASGPIYGRSGGGMIVYLINPTGA
jgi:hypothetical protein